MSRPLPWLDRDTPFPDPAGALDNPPGLLAVGADLSPERLIAAYREGIFPWFQDDDPILWWSPDPRCVIDPASFQPTRSLRQRVKRGDLRISCDRAFAEVIAGCAEPRAYADDTWITPDIQSAYIRLHELGVAHSVEIWLDAELVGGLYGIAVGGLFCGESMFNRDRDASKLAFWALMTLCAHWRQPWVDCQLVNPHLLSLGAQTLSRADWRRELATYRDCPLPDWRQAEAILRESTGFTGLVFGARGS